MDFRCRNHSASGALPADLLATFQHGIGPALCNWQGQTVAEKLSDRRILIRRGVARRSYSMGTPKDGLGSQKKRPPPQAYSPSRKSTRPTAPPASPASSNPLRFRKVPLILAGLTACAISGYSTYLYVGYKRAIASGATENVPADVSYRYNAIASDFDSSVDYQERLMGLTKLRKRMVQEASGHVCEVSIGTGRNITFYDWDVEGVNGVGKVGADNKIKRGKVKSFTAVDKSRKMLQIAHEKFSKQYPEIIGIRWIVQDASQPLPLPQVSSKETNENTSTRKYDTIVQTMGLCSTADPVGLLKNLGDSVQQDGRILLLEHGKGTWGWLNDILDSFAPRHALEFGCWWNKDIGQIVEDSGLEVVKIERKNFGTTWWIELKPKPREADDGQKDLVATSPAPDSSSPNAIKRSWWPF